MRGRKKLLCFAVPAVLLLIVTALANRIAPYDPDAQNILQALKAPCLSHIFGTDRYGRDVFSRVLAGGRVSVYAGLLLTFTVAASGTAVGVLGGWYGGRADMLLMRCADLFLAFPSLVFALAVAGVLGGGLTNAVIALAAVGWPKYARLARGLVLGEKESSYILAARLSGSGFVKILFRHLLPNIGGQILAAAVSDIGTMMIELAGLSFLGLGVKPPMAEWGSMISEGRSMLQLYPWMVLAPGGAVFLAVTVFNLLGDALREYMDPAQRR